MIADQIYMDRALELAHLGAGKVAPNPMVGAVIAHEGRIIGEGYHQYYGGPHAEVNAINSVEDPLILRESTLFVTLEPCNHTGLTPPCTNLILENAIPKVVIAQLDPNPLVGGKGIERLRQNGVEVMTGVLENKARELNRRFNVFHEKKRPYIILKWAQTSDGFIDINRGKDDSIQPNWITDDFCRRIVHKWRSEEAAIMVGTETALKDNPKLNIRSWLGEDPLRIVLDQNLRLPESINLFDKSIPTLVYTSKSRSNQDNIEYVKAQFGENILHSIMEDLFARSVQSLIVEGGEKLLNSFIKQGLWDEARVFIGPSEFQNGIKAPNFPFALVKSEQTGNSILKTFRNKKTG